MKIQYASDLHLEFQENRKFLKKYPIKSKGDILILAGDIMPFTQLNNHSGFFNYISDNFQVTYWIPGNHEYYYFDAATKCGAINEKIRENVLLVNNVSILYDDIKLIFSTLWSKIRPSCQWQIERGVSDFHAIKYNGFRFSSEQFNRLHEESLDFIVSEISKKDNYKSVVVTHHTPTLKNYPEKYKGSVINDAFAVELFDIIEIYKPALWIYGHTHFNTPDFNIGSTILITNQLGYVSHGEHLSFDTAKTITI
jgi:predicted phosphohydrolase